MAPVSLIQIVTGIGAAHGSVMDIAIEGKTWILGKVFALLLAAFSVLSILQLFYRVVALASKSRRHRCIELEEREKDPCLLSSPVVNKARDLDEDVLIEILSRLPVKTLFQIKSVCRRWNEIIANSPLLVSMHLKNYTNSPASSASQTLIYEAQVMGSYKTIMQLDPEGDTSQIRYLEPPMQVQTKPSEPPLGVISGPCNGIFLMGPLYGTNSRFVLWNPTNGSFRQLPLVPPIRRSSILPPAAEFFSQNCGFGLDTVANDFKVVLIRHFRLPGRKTLSDCGGYSSSECPSQVLVYTLGTDTWRELEELRHEVEIFNFIECYRYLNGFCFWLCVSPVAALAFDLGNDVFHLINDPVPVQVPDPDDVRGLARMKQLAMYKDSLALFICHQGKSCVYDMWLLNEQWCWVKHLTIGPFRPERTKQMLVAGYWRDGKLIMVVPGFEYSTVLFDPATEAIDFILYDCSYHHFVYRESLVSVDRG